MTEPAEKDTPEQMVSEGAPVATTDAARIATLEAELTAVKDQALRAMAETDNTRKRAVKERDDAMKYGTTALAKELLGVADNLRRALEHAGALEGDAAKNFVAGVEATERQLLASFERAGIRKNDPLGQMFDPNLHQVMLEVENTGKPAGTVVQVLQPGYVIHDRLLREALVGVAKSDGNSVNSINTMA